MIRSSVVGRPVRAARCPPIMQLQLLQMQELKLHQSRDILTCQLRQRR
jgi:hypothetical protein